MKVVEVRVLSWAPSQSCHAGAMEPDPPKRAASGRLFLWPEPAAGVLRNAPAAAGFAASRNDRCACAVEGGIQRRHDMNSVIYLVGLVVVVIAVLSFFGLR
ncbi:hypothetical protein ABEG18_26370 [Alsobacter sp. KACC 23698]|uniref:Uncharacterized protein n=1 Tax=Alsobacter sp. KACC 23698 TaxID=3149229 RepID=A0AAU7JFH9_9HYPH